MILPAEENVRSGAAEVADTAKTFLPKRAIHGTTEKARLKSFRGFLCDGNSCTRILHKVISSSAMSRFVERVRTRFVERARRCRRCCSKPVTGFVIISDVSAHGLIRSPGFVNEHHQHVLDMLPSCFYLSWGYTRETRNIPSIQTSTHDWICEKWQIQRERKRPHRDVSDSAISECIIFVKSMTDRTEQEKRGKDCAHTSQ